MNEYELPVHVDFAPGALGLEIPAHQEMLRRVGEDFLTQAFRRFGSISPDNRVTRIKRFEVFEGGTSGHKVTLSLEYARDEANLHSELFVKFSRAFDNPYRDRRRFELESEVRLASLSRLSAFPVRVAKAYFADFDPVTGVGILITERIPYGVGVVEPRTPKCMDYDLPAPLEYYEAILSALARLAGAHKRGDLSPEVEEFFPFDPIVAAADDAIPWDQEELRDRIARYAAFAEQCPQLLPAHVTTPQFIQRWQREALRCLRHEPALKRFLHAAPNLIALCHWNAHVDNAFFWRDTSGKLECGLVDWGRARQMNVVYALWGSLCGAGADIWDNHLDHLLNLFISEFLASGGPRLDLEELKLHLDVYIALIGIVEMMNVPAVFMSSLPNAPSLSGPRDIVLKQNELPRVILHIFSLYLHLWDRRELGSSIDRALLRPELPIDPRK